MEEKVGRVVDYLVAAVPSAYHPMALCAQS